MNDQRGRFLILKTVLAAVLLSGGLHIHVTAADRTDEVEVLATREIEVDGRPNLLVLTRSEIRPAKKVDQGLRLVSFTLNLFDLTNGGIDRGPGKTVWRDYTQYLSGVYPRARWSADLTSDSDSSTTHMVVLVSLGLSGSIMIFEVEPKRMDKTNIPSFDDKGRLVGGERDPRSEPVSKYDFDLWDERCLARDVQVLTERGSLLIVVDRSPKCDPMYLRYDHDKKTFRRIHWTEVEESNGNETRAESE